ncbi:MAG: type II toxin-antitoxin system HipA family toxin, partial [Pseudorhodoplanes sp.]
ACRPFFSGLLPEEGQREAVARALGISKGNDFALLNALGGDVAGALTLWPEGKPPPSIAAQEAPTPLGDNALIAMLDELPKRPMLAGKDGLRLSLAGVQSKIPVVLVDGAIALPAPGQPTTHILKPPIERFSGTTENEAFAMMLAAEVGLSVASVEPRVVADRRFLLIERYDRTKDASGRIVRLHQEDFCQALGIPPEHKYAAEGGPTFKNGFELLRRAAARPAVEVLKLLDAAIFNLIVGNADAHGKNYSLLYRADGTTLAPLYDLLSTVAYPELSPKLAMKIAKCATLEEIDDGTWPKFAADAGLAAPFVRRRVEELAAAIEGATSAVTEKLEAPGLSQSDLERFSALVADRAGRLR